MRYIHEPCVFETVIIEMALYVIFRIDWQLIIIATYYILMKIALMAKVILNRSAPSRLRRPIREGRQYGNSKVLHAETKLKVTLKIAINSYISMLKYTFIDLKKY